MATHSKSLGLHVLEQFFPGAFVTARERVTSAHIVVEDALVGLNQLGKGELDPCSVTPCRITDCSVIFECFKKSSEYVLNNSRVYPNAHTYAYCFDKIDYVPIGKGHTQAIRSLDKSTGSQGESNSKTANVQKRSKARQKASEVDRTPDDKVNFKDRRPYLKIGTPLPKDINLAIDDRDDTRKEIIRNIVCSWLSTGSQFKFDIPKGKSVVIDGHCLRYNDLRTIKFDNELTEDDGTTKIDLTEYGKLDGEKKKRVDELIVVTPIQFIKTGPLQYSIRWANELRNYIGEADFGMFFMHKRLTDVIGKGIQHLEIVTNDTDIVYLGLIYISKYGVDAASIYMRIHPKAGWVYFRNMPSNDYEYGIILNRLYKDIDSANWEKTASGKSEITDSSDKDKSNKNKGSYFVDDEAEEEGEKKKRKKRDYWDDYDQDKQYKSDFRKLKHRVLTTVCAFVSYGGDYLYGYQGITCETIMHTLRKHSKYIGDLISINQESPYKITLDGRGYTRLVKSQFLLYRGFKDKSGSQLKPAETDMIMIVEMSSKGVAKNMMPPPEAIELHAHHMMYYLKLIYQIGNDVLIEPYCLAYEYELVNKNEPLSRSNVRRKTISPENYREYHEAVNVGSLKKSQKQTMK